jgi:hypothetical protein
MDTSWDSLVIMLPDPRQPASLCRYLEVVELALLAKLYLRQVDRATADRRR